MQNLSHEVLDALSATFDVSNLDEDYPPRGVITGFDPGSVTAIQEKIKGHFLEVPISGAPGEDFFQGCLFSTASTLMFVRIPDPSEPGGNIPPSKILNRALKGLSHKGTLVLDLSVEDLGQLTLHETFLGFNCLELAGKRLLLWGQRCESLTGNQLEANLTFLDDLGDGLAALPCLKHTIALEGHEFPVFQPSQGISVLREIEAREIASDLMLNQFACKGLSIEQVFPLVPLKAAHQAMVQILGGLNREFTIDGNSLAVYTAIRKRKHVEITREEAGFKEEIETETPYLQVTIADLSSGEVYDLT